MTTRDLDGAAHVAACRQTVKAKVWCDDTGCGCWLWSCWSCGIKQWVPSWALAYKFAEAHVSIWHRNGRMPATATTLPADGPAHSMAHNQPTPTAWHQEA